MKASIASKHPKRSPRTWKLLIIASIVGGMCFLPRVSQLKVYGQTRPTETVRTELATFFQVYLSRQLSQKELEQVTQEFILYFGGSTCEAKCVQALDSHMNNLRIFKTKRGQPEELVLRHAYISQNYFSPKQQGTLIQRLLAEPDPIRVVNPSAKRLMTEKDVVALANLGIFLNNPSSPKHQSFSPQEIDEVVVLLDRLVGSQANAQKMPILFVTAAEFWAGIQHNWSKLSATEKQMVIDYIKYKSNKPMPVHLYSRLLGLPVDQAQILQNSEQLDAMNNIGSSYLDLMKNYGFLRYMPYGPSF